jgi:hypothetical protein
VHSVRKECVTESVSELKISEEIVEHTKGDMELIRLKKRLHRQSQGV